MPVLTEAGELVVTEPKCSGIIDVTPSHPCPLCKKAGVTVRLLRCNGEVTDYWCHDDGSFIQWTGELNTQ